MCEWMKAELLIVGMEGCVCGWEDALECGPRVGGWSGLMAMRGREDGLIGGWLGGWIGSWLGEWMGWCSGGLIGGWMICCSGGFVCCDFCELEVMVDLIAMPTRRHQSSFPSEAADGEDPCVGACLLSVSTSHVRVMGEAETSGCMWFAYAVEKK
jgi:hypothetical protein